MSLFDRSRSHISDCSYVPCFRSSIQTIVLFQIVFSLAQEGLVQEEHTQRKQAGLEYVLGFVKQFQHLFVQNHLCLGCLLMVDLVPQCLRERQEVVAQVVFYQQLSIRFDSELKSKNHLFCLLVKFE